MRRSTIRRVASLCLILAGLGSVGAEEGPPADASWTRRTVPVEERQHWAFQPLRVIPQEFTCVDDFIAAKHRELGLRGNPPAPRWQWLRRASFDLTGLPPTPDEIEAFERDDSPEALENVLDRLLASPRFGERWARHWLDVARYGESEGGEHDYDREHAYYYRDFVIKAFNQDMPFDQFVRWQIAGDEFAPDDPLALMATGFLVAGTFPTQLTEREFEQARYDQLDDMASTTAAAFLGLTLGCARCHDHKYDPIPAADYYRFTSAFARTIRSEVDVDLMTAEERGRLETERVPQRAAAEAALADYEREELPRLFAHFLKEPTAPAAPWTVLFADRIGAEQGTRLERQPDGALLADRDGVPALDSYQIEGSVRGRVTAVRLEALTHGSLPRNGPGLADNGNFCLGNLRVTLNGEKVHVRGTRVTHQQNTESLSAAASLDDDQDNTGWAVDNGGIGRDQIAVFVLDPPVDAGVAGRLGIEMRFHHPNTRHALGRFRLAVTGDDPTTVPLTSENEPVPLDVLDTLARLREGRETDLPAREKAVRWFASTQAEWRRLTKTVADFRLPVKGQDVAKVQVGGEAVPKLKHNANDRGYPHFYPETHFLSRGDPARKAGVAAPGFLQVLVRDGVEPARWIHELPENARTTLRRRALAEWMTDTEHGAGHLLARVMVNRLWQHHFGRGLVATPNDFGTQGAPPSHPLLLDWLARRLIDGGWRLKPLHKLMMASAAYRQNGDHDAARAGIDRENTYLWRRPVQRLEAEALRDAILFVSGELDETPFGPGERDAGMKRRSIYFHLRRSQIPAALQIFDFPEPLVSQGSRPATVTAPQALLLMNNPQVRDCALALAQRLPENDAEAVGQLYLCTLGRPAGAEELAASLRFLERQAAAYREQERPDARRLARADLCQTLFAHNAFVFVQ